MKKPIPMVTALALVTLMVTGCGPKSIYEKEDTYTGRIALVDGTDTAGATWDPVTATSEVERVLNKSGKDVDVILSNNDGMALGILKSKVFQDAKIPVFGVDALGDALTEIKKGTMAGTIKNDSYLQANVALQLVVNLANGVDIKTGIIGAGGIDGVYDKYETEAKAFRVHHKMVTKANVDSFTPPAPVEANTIGDTTTAGRKKVFALTYQNSDPNMSGLWKPGFNDFGKKLHVEVEWVDAAGDEQKAQEALAAAIAKGGYDAYLINPVDQKNIKTYIDKVKPTTKPIIVWNREGDAAEMAKYDKAYYVGIESAEGGRLQGQMAAEWFNTNYTDATKAKYDRNGDGKIGYIVVRGEKGHPDAEARTIASPENLESHLTIFKK